VNKKIRYTILLLLFFSATSIAQVDTKSGQILLLKDKGIVVHSYTVGDYISFQFSNQQWLTGYIDWIKNDSIQINQFALQSTLSVYGTYGQDTLKLGTLALQLKEIIAFPIQRGHYNSVFTNGVFFMTGGIGYLGLNAINSLSNKDPLFAADNIPKILGGAIAWAVGHLLYKTHPNYRPIGKRFSIETL
jgi:hypothetical protein